MDEIARKSCAIFAQTDRDWSAAWSRFSSSAPAGQTGAPTSGACRGPAGPPLGYRLPPGFLRQPAVEPPNDASTWAKRIASAQKPRLDNAGGHPTQASSSVATTTKRLVARTPPAICRASRRCTRGSCASALSDTRRNRQAGFRRDRCPSQDRACPPPAPRARSRVRHGL